MLDPHGLYTLNDDVVATLREHRPVLIHQLDGFVDAGQAGRLFSAHLLEQLDHEVLAIFDVDQLHDYRAGGRRWCSTQPLGDVRRAALTVAAMRDAAGTPYLLLTGPEPDVQWERIARAVRRLVDELGVRLTIGLNAIPMAVPHTRSAGVIAHGSDRALTEGFDPWVATVQVPGAAGHLLEFRLGQSGIDAAGFAVHVPHYVAQAPYPAATLTLTRSLNSATGLAVPLSPLEKASASNMADIAEEMQGSSEVQELVATLEQQYDTLQAERPERVPSAEEIAAEFERFLADREKND